MITEKWGLWDITKITIRWITKHHVQISCPRIVVNGEARYIDVIYTPLDRIRGIKFEDKVARKLLRFARKMSKLNEQIVELRKKEEAAHKALKLAIKQNKFK